MNEVFFQISAVLAITLGVGAILRLLKQPLIVAYLIAGICAGPMLFNIIHAEQETFQVFSRLGVILLLFVVGLSLNFSYLKKIGKVAAISGIGQVLFTAGFGTLLLVALKFSGGNALRTPSLISIQTLSVT